MRAKCFTNKEVSELQKNKYTAYVSNHSIRFTLEFKQLFLQMRAQGMECRRIFQEIGYNTDVLGKMRIKNFSKSVRRESVSEYGLHESYSRRRKRISVQ